MCLISDTDILFQTLKIVQTSQMVRVLDIPGISDSPDILDISDISVSQYIRHARHPRHSRYFRHISKSDISDTLDDSYILDHKQTVYYAMSFCANCTRKSTSS